MKIKPLLSNLLILNCLIVISSCSSFEKKEKVVTKVPEMSIQEKERMRALETYRQMRLKALERDQHRRKHFTKVRKSQAVKKSQKVITVVPTPTPAPTPSYPKKDAREIMIEVEQNLTFFCMKYRKNQRFKEENSCELFTQEKLKECQDIHLETDNARLISCVKSRLRL